MSDPAAAGSGNVTTAQVRDSTGHLMISGLTIGIPGSTADAVIDNGANSTLISSGRVAQLLAAQLTGS
jgi:hypothetical protein